MPEWSNNTVRVLARNVSNTTIDLAAAPLTVQEVNRRIPVSLRGLGADRRHSALGYLSPIEYEARAMAKND